MWGCVQTVLPGELPLRTGGRSAWRGVAGGSETPFSPPTGHLASLGNREMPRTRQSLGDGKIHHVLYLIQTETWLWAETPFLHLPNGILHFGIRQQLNVANSCVHWWAAVWGPTSRSGGSGKREWTTEGTRPLFPAPWLELGPLLPPAGVHTVGPLLPRTPSPWPAPPLPSPACRRQMVGLCLRSCVSQSL